MEKGNIMATKSTKSAGVKSAKRDAPKVMNFFNINGSLYSLGDLRKADFSSLEDPKASVKSLQAWAIQVSNILRGFSQEE